MLSERILATLKYFDLQDMPLTLFELHAFLLPDIQSLKTELNDRYELAFEDKSTNSHAMSMDAVYANVEELLAQRSVVMQRGFYILPGRELLVEQRLKGYTYGIYRERLINRFIRGVAYLPGIRAVAIGGSQAIGQHKATSDIDLFIITAERWLWRARTLITAYFQVLGVRRHGNKITNRFCLNHYIAGPHVVHESRDLYKATDFAKLRPVYNPRIVAEFQKHNWSWIKVFFPNAVATAGRAVGQTWLQRIGEWLLDNRFGTWVENTLGTWQLARIRKGEYIVATEKELSFHSRGRKQQLFEQLFGSRQNVIVK